MMPLLFQHVAQRKMCNFVQCLPAQLKQSTEFDFCYHCFLFLTDSDIKHFMETYQKLCPAESLFPKLHYMESHLVGFIQKWRAGPGLLGEHGGESIHHQFNQLKTRFLSIPSATDLLQHMLCCHLQAVNPDNREAPAKKLRAK